MFYKKKNIYFVSAFLQNIASKLTNIAPAFNSSRSENTSTTCKLHTKQFIEALKRLELWAFQSKFAQNTLLFS